MKDTQAVLNEVDFSLAPNKAPRCMECDGVTRLVTGAECYPDEPHMHDQPAWQCDCGAFARCRPGTIFPLTRPAGPDVRALRNRLAIASSNWRRMAREGGQSSNAVKRNFKALMKQNGVSAKGQWISRSDLERAVALFEGAAR